WASSATYCQPEQPVRFTPKRRPRAPGSFSRKRWTRAAAAGVRVTDMDCSPAMLQLYRWRAAAHPPSVKLRPLPYRARKGEVQGMTVVSVQHALAGRLPVGGEVTVRGWVRTRRDSKAGLSFVNVSDGSCFAPIQVVAPASLPNYESEVKHLTAGCAVVASGELVESQGKGQGFEIQASRIEVVGWVEDPETYPIQPKPHSLEFLREVAHLRPRTNLFGAVTRIRHTLSMAVHRYFHRNGYFWISTPIITTSDAEGAGQMFRVSTLDL